jgi:hypothetical protein
MNEITWYADGWLRDSPCPALVRGDGWEIGDYLLYKGRNIETYGLERPIVSVWAQEYEGLWQD